MSWDCLSKIITETRENAFRPAPQLIKKDYISEATWKLILKRQQLKKDSLSTVSEEGGTKEIILKSLTNQIKKRARQDRSRAAEMWIEEHLLDNEQWKGVRNIKKAYTPQRFELKSPELNLKITTSI